MSQLQAFPFLAPFEVYYELHRDLCWAGPSGIQSQR